MNRSPSHHLAEFNLGLLRHPWGDARVQGFADGLDLVNGVAARSSGFVWRLCDDDMEAAQRDPDGPLGADSRRAATLSVWESVETLEHFVWNTVHRQFYDRRAEWYDAVETLRFVMWWVPVASRPYAAEAMARFRHLEAHGDSNPAFGWKHLDAARLWQSHGCHEKAVA